MKLSPDFSSRPEARRSRLLRGESALISIVFVIVSDPVAPGFVPGVRRGGQITGQDVARRLISGREPPGCWSEALVHRTSDAKVVNDFEA